MCKKCNGSLGSLKRVKLQFNSNFFHVQPFGVWKNKKDLYLFDSSRFQQTYIALFKAVLQNGFADVSTVASHREMITSFKQQQTVKQNIAFELWGEGKLPRMGILRPNMRNLRGVLTCVFPLHRQQFHSSALNEFKGQEIVLQNEGSLLCEVSWHVFHFAWITATNQSFSASC